MSGYFQAYLNYYLFMLPGIIISIWASIRVKSAFSRYSRISNSRGLTGADAAMAVLRANGVNNVRIERVSGELTDHYDPRTNVIRLSDSVYGSASVAAVGVAAHEAGHAVQYAHNYGPVKLRSAIIPVCNFGAKLSLPLIIIGSLLLSDWLILAGIALFALSVLFQVVTLPVEFNASRRALSAIEQEGLLRSEERTGAKKVLSAAAMTYVASLLQSLLILFYYLSRYNRRR